MLEGCARAVGPGDARVARIAQVVADLAGADFSGSRVLDLGCDEGNFARAIARLGALQVLGIEGRAEKLPVAHAKRDAEGLADRVDIVAGDVREVSRERHGEFDVVLCLGLLYHLDGGDLLPFLRHVRDMTTRFAIIETQIAIAPRVEVELDERRYAGLWYEEDTSRSGASLDNRRSFWPTKPSLFNLLHDVGFTSVLEVAAPFIPSVGAFRDHVVLVALTGDRVSDDPVARVPERMTWVTHPAQGRRYAVRERLLRLRGGGLPSVFRHPTP